MSLEDVRESARLQLVTVCRDLLGGQISALEAAIIIHSLASDLDPDQLDSDLLGFVGISSSVDHLLLGDPKVEWHPDVREKKEREVEEAEAFFLEGARASAEALLVRFG